MFANDTTLMRKLSNPYADIQMANVDVRQMSKWIRRFA